MKKLNSLICCALLAFAGMGFAGGMADYREVQLKQDKRLANIERIQAKEAVCQQSLVKAIDLRQLR